MVASEGFSVRHVSFGSSLAISICRGCLEHVLQQSMRRGMAIHLALNRSLCLAVARLVLSSKHSRSSWCSFAVLSPFGTPWGPLGILVGASGCYRARNSVFGRSPKHDVAFLLVLFCSLERFWDVLGCSWDPLWGLRVRQNPKNDGKQYRQTGFPPVFGRSLKHDVAFLLVLFCHLESFWDVLGLSWGSL